MKGDTRGRRVITIMPGTAALACEPPSYLRAEIEILRELAKRVAVPTPPPREGVREDPAATVSLRELSRRRQVSVRTLWKWLALPIDPLPCYRLGKKVLVRLGEFDAWLDRRRRGSDTDRIVDEVVVNLRRGGRR